MADTEVEVVVDRIGWVETEVEHTLAEVGFEVRSVVVEEVDEFALHEARAQLRS